MSSQLQVLIATVVVAIILPAQAQVNQVVTLYPGTNGGGQGLTLVENYQPNLAQQGFNDIAYSTCVVGT